MHSDYPEWLRKAVPSESTSRTKLSELRRVEVTYGDLDTLYDQDELSELLDELTYSMQDARTGRENPSRLQISGDIRNNLASYKSAVMKYQRFRQDVETEAGRPVSRQASSPDITETDLDDAATLSLEVDLQRALRANIEQIEPGLQIIDGGAERTVPSGRIDILAKDAAGKITVIELKAVKARRDVIGQIAAYMGDLLDEAGNAGIRGILIAPDFDEKVIKASRVMPNLELMRFSFQFSFTPLA